MITTNSSGSTIPTMRYDGTLHRVRAEGFRVGAWQDRLGSTIFAPGRPVLAGELCVTARQNITEYYRMAYDQLSRPWRVTYAILGFVFLVGGAFGTAGELGWAIMYGYLAAWPAALFTAAITCLGGYLLYASWRGRIRTLGLHIGRNR